MSRKRTLLAAAASAALAAAGAAYAVPRDQVTVRAESFGCPVFETPRDGRMRVERVDPGAHRAEARRVAAAFNGVGATVRLRIVTNGAPTEIRVLPDRDLGGNVISQTRGCLLPGWVSARPTITMDAGRPAGSVKELALAHALGVALGLRTNDRDECSTMASAVNRTIAGCERPALLQPADRRALLAVWGQPAQLGPPS